MRAPAAPPEAPPLPAAAPRSAPVRARPGRRPRRPPHAGLGPRAPRGVGSEPKSRFPLPPLPASVFLLAGRGVSILPGPCLAQEVLLKKEAHLMDVQLHPMFA
ncbi:hypothetical protein VULLAG_LOCUS11727 [Vulpes lagopus]